MNKVETYNRNNILSQIKWLIKMVRYLLGKEISEGGSIQSIQEGDNISIDNTDPQNPVISSTGGDTPTLSEVLAEGNNPFNNNIVLPDSFSDSFYIEGGSSYYKNQLKMGIGTSSHGTIQLIASSDPDDLDKSNSANLYIGQQTNSKGYIGLSLTDNDYINNTFKYASLEISNSIPLGNSVITIRDELLNKGIEGGSYYGANYDDNTYVQKKYVDDNTMINPTLITGYDAGETQTLKNVNGVLTWVTD